MTIFQRGREIGIAKRVSKSTIPFLDPVVGICFFWMLGFVFLGVFDKMPEDRDGGDWIYVASVPILHLNRLLDPPTVQAIIHDQGIDLASVELVRANHCLDESDSEYTSDHGFYHCRPHHRVRIQGLHPSDLVST